MTWRGTIGLAAVLAALAAALWWAERPAPDRTPGAPAALLASSAEITALEIRVAGATHRWDVARGRWRTASGDVAPAGVETLVEALQTISPLMVVDAAPTAPAEFGFGPDAVRLVVWAGETPLLDLDVGARNPAWTGVYVRRHGARAIEMVGALLAWELAKVLGPVAPASALTKRHETGEPSR